MSPAGYDAARARTKRPVPIWADALLRDTLHLSAEEVGAWHLLIYAMWARPTLDLPDNDRKLATITRMSTRKWRATIRPVMEPLFQVADGVWRNRRLSEAARRTEEFCMSQSERSRMRDAPYRGEPLPLPEVDHPADEYRSALLRACGLPANHPGPVANEAQMVEARRWQTDLGLSVTTITAEIGAVMNRRRDGEPVQSLAYFTKAMERAAGRRDDAASKEIQPRSGGRHDGYDAHDIGAAADRIAAANPRQG
ncbi:MAG: YdaU family protein [Rhodobacteraceae bacterium]|nr:YdaU family protein [Mameliella sp. LZ-28]MCR9276219.1 YdaU family protein [Paracoccaceae bacterium]